MNDIYKEIYFSQREWLASLIRANGEFIMNDKSTNSKYSINPYFANISAIALLDNKDYLLKIKKYLIWYLTNINLPDKHNVYGTIYDYKVDDSGTLESTNDYDSYDSYAATFITLCRRYFDISTDFSFFEDFKDQFNILIECLMSSMDKDYLTWAKPDYKVKYLMDNCEVYRGLVDAGYIYSTIYKDKELYKKYFNIAKSNYISIEKNLYDTSGFYNYLMFENNKKNKPKMQIWYPDSTSQLYPILYGLIEPTSIRAKSIYDNFNKYNPNWSLGIDTGNFPNTFVSYVGLLMNDITRVK